MSNQMLNIFKDVKQDKKVDSYTGAYTFIEKRLSDSSLIPTNDVSTIAKWFKVKYEEKYNKPMIGYNFFNCRLAIKTIGEHYKINNWEVCCLINKWFTTFHTLGFDKLKGDNTLTVGILKTSWIVDKLKKGVGPNSNARNESYKVHGESRRERTKPNPSISKHSF